MSHLSKVLKNKKINELELDEELKKETCKIINQDSSSDNFTDQYYIQDIEMELDNSSVKSESEN